MCLYFCGALFLWATSTIISLNQFFNFNKVKLVLMLGYCSYHITEILGNMEKSFIVMDDSAYYCCSSAVRGYVVYQYIWEVSNGEVIGCMVWYIKINPAEVALYGTAQL